ncbi:Predicted oxidoreductase, contains short-chain dehydrogenase (SDR) and DUF2520 domains [Flavobacteriaceae bacterium MAR_2010_188]|nr:Predicted oxidoreductase, contains short-chain dehydrogenase (SDR) and DUF2520 domains [Flavobacteriaceae bacterium MAR_2010_188]
MISVVLIGAGKVAKHLFKALNRSLEVSVKQWYNRDISVINPWKSKVEIIDDLNKLQEADLYILCISDDAIAKISRKLPFKNRFVVHTSGTVNVHDLDKKNRRGVFYPLQTFSKESEINFEEIPLCIEAIDKNDYQLLKKLAQHLGCKYYKISTEQRQTLHLSAVFVNNFVNQLYRIGHEICEEKYIEFEILKPLIMETASKLNDMSPYQAQTGPALRNDKKTITKHLKLLENKEHKQIYQLLTKSIKKTHGR